MKSSVVFVVRIALVVVGLVAGHEKVQAGDEAGLPQFVHVSREAGLDFAHVNGATGRYYPVEINGGGLVAFDYDSDGWVDLYVVNGSALPGYFEEGPRPVNRLYRNLGDGTFADVTAVAGVGDSGYGMGCAAGDVDNDGDLDLYVSNYGSNVLYRNNGDGTFTDITEVASVGDGGWGGGCAFADYDGDGDLDLYVANYVVYELGEDGSGVVPYVTKLIKERNKSDLELYPSPLNFPAAHNRLYRNEGEGKFVEVAEEAGVADADGRGMGVVFVDYDGDGDPDLFVADDQGGNSLFRNEGNGRFVDVGLASGVGYDGEGNAQATMGVDAGDYDNDGRFDLVTTAFQSEAFALYRNMGSGFFMDEAFPSGTGGSTLPRLGWGVFGGDMDNDGWMDLFMANGHVQDGIERVDPGAKTAQQNLLFRNVGNGKFQDVSDRSGVGMMLERQSRGAVWLDYDNDGDLDVAVLNRFCRLPAGVENGVDLLRNDGGNRKHWFQVLLMGGEGTNRFGVGARVSVWVGGMRQVQEVRCGSGYQSQNDMRVHFGLGAEGVVDSLEVWWPGGGRQVWKEVRGDRVVRVVEGGTIDE